MALKGGKYNLYCFENDRYVDKHSNHTSMEMISKWNCVLTIFGISGIET